MNQFQSLVALLFLAMCQAFTSPQQPQQRSIQQVTTLTSTYTGQLWYPPIESDSFQLPRFPTPELGIQDTVATMAASWILGHLPSLQQSAPDCHEKQCHLNEESLTEILLQDICERNSLVTADFASSIYEDSCRFKDGSDLDGSYPMKPWQLGCKMLFKGDKSKSNIVEDSLVVTSEAITFRFESDLEFRGPFSPQVLLTGRVVMLRNPQTGLISSYEEKWDDNVWDIVKGAKLQV